MEASFKIYRIMPAEDGSMQTIASCPGHIQRIMEELNTTKVLIESVDPAMHTCMGCLKGW